MTVPGVMGRDAMRSYTQQRSGKVRTSLLQGHCRERLTSVFESNRTGGRGLAT